MIPFNKPYLSGMEIDYIKDAIKRGKISGDGYYTHTCHEFFEQKYGFKKCLLTTSCTDALEMASILCDIQPGDEVIVPSYTFVSTANAFVLRGAKIVFVDSRPDHPGIDESKIEELITTKTKVIVPVHYAGVACDMNRIMALADKYNLFVVEDAAQAIDSYYEGKPLGGIGHFGCFSFHETKNIQSGEGGMLVINDERFFSRAEIIWEKGTNRSAFWRGEIDKYGWVDIGSSFLPSEMTAAFLFGQLENLDRIQKRRKQIWQHYNNLLKPLAENGLIDLPYLPTYTSNNGHLFYLVCKNQNDRHKLISFLKSKNINAVFHYLALHKSSFYKRFHIRGVLNMANHYENCLLRLPIFYELEDYEIDIICDNIIQYYNKK